tara:strand:+ start:214 stop:474 length:261 start_codon:yes stop_codon:yes gene_type:complete
MTNKQVVVANYATRSVFKIPSGIDLEDRNVVNRYYVRWDILHIHYVDESQDEIHCSFSTDIDYKEPAKITIEDSSEFQYSSDEDEY